MDHVSQLCVDTAKSHLLMQLFITNGQIVLKRTRRRRRRRRRRRKRRRSGH